ncbi:MAG TPA: tRNA (adenosine(37)-N6)-threonylcarbamoyltransferase complex ATPase subunit type 1 TsaE [Candidatus Moranbacteria bacterium]|nr:tRNA (adenosine(37)-N6)-threonylcarbamoyltransferase complex ATPase subunit type 1 TsaE [Candidatus Moranbacteria bacterium]HRZ33497.1 tRNA (adenosine(37)-N6)-threonylcarbamoyltransferase complex ATPase subunit type 1 TsaE [Candidatus Moranbacteria bacterium]
MAITSFVTTSSVQTKKIGEILAKELRGGEIICLSGDLGSGKTTFTQGILKGLKIKGPFTSPTFNIIKTYKIKSKIIYHIDAYRIEAKDLLELGWKDFAGKPNSIVIIEWAERVKKIIPKNSLWINFKWIRDKERKISLNE